MSDLILIINLIESRRKRNLIIETCEGKINLIKDNQYSGPIRNINILDMNCSDNLTSKEICTLRKELFNIQNIQISKYQFILNPNDLEFIINLIPKRCLFYLEKKGMFLIEHIELNSSRNESFIQIGDISLYVDKTYLFITYKHGLSISSSSEPKAMFYIDILSNSYKAELSFDYGKYSVNYFSKRRVFSDFDIIRNYGFEENIVTVIREAHWVISDDCFIYKGRSIADDIQLLEMKGIRLFTSEKQEVHSCNISNVNIGYGIDWFSIDGNLEADGYKFDISDFIDINSGKKWKELKGTVFFIPEKLEKLQANMNVDKDGSLKISKRNFLDVLNIASDFNVRNIRNIEDLVDYRKVEYSISPSIDALLREYQKLGVKWLLSLKKNGFGGCLADDMGLGKTIQVIAFLSDSSMKNEKTIIIVPKTLIENWRREFIKFSPTSGIYIYHGPKRNEQEIKKNNIIITTYTTFVNDYNQLSKIYFSNMIIDEAQLIKNSSSKAYKAINSLKTDTKILMTGTPLENNLKEYWDLMRIVNKTKLTFKAVVNGLSSEQALDKIKRITNPFLLRRVKSDVLSELPEKRLQIVYCDFSEEQRQLYLDVLNSIKMEIARIPDKFEIKSSAVILRGLLYLQEICCHPRLLPKEINKDGISDSSKLTVLIQMVSELNASNHKIIVFSRFTGMLEIIKQALLKLDLNIFYLDGKTRNRQDVVDSFEQADHAVFLISLKAGGVGLNLVSADTAVFFDPWWNPAVEKQAEDRIYRIGQKNNVMIYKLIISDSIEEKVQSLQIEKMNLFDKIVNGHEMPSDINMKEIITLINNL